MSPALVPQSAELILEKAALGWMILLRKAGMGLTPPAMLVRSIVGLLGSLLPMDREIMRRNFLGL